MSKRRTGRCVRRASVNMRSKPKPTAPRRPSDRSERVAEPPNLDDIRRALQSNEFFLVYQPVVTLDGRHCVGAEALIRWRRHGSGPVIAAGDFIPRTENTPLSGA